MADRADTATSDTGDASEPGRAAGVTTDGRRLRADRSRAAVVEAILSLYEDGQLEPGAAAIAERAGVSERSVFRHFEDLENLARVAVEVALERIGPLFEVVTPTDGSLDERIEAVVAQRFELYRNVAAATRGATRLATQSRTLADALAFRRLVLREQVATLFEPEIAGRPEAERSTLVGALDAACSIEQLESLVFSARHDIDSARAIVTLTLHALLDDAR